jgi:hypothetical protein
MSLFTTPLPHQRIRLCFASAGLVLLSTGCLTYSPQQLSAMPAMQLCEMQLYSRVNLNNETKGRLQDELKKRNEDCRQYVAGLEKQRADDRETAMYLRNGP